MITDLLQSCVELQNAEAAGSYFTYTLRLKGNIK
jgi:hypothetical protein